MHPRAPIVVTDPELATLVGTLTEAADEYVKGHIRHYLELVPDAPDFTLMPPYGGPAFHDLDRSDEAVEVTSSFFGDGEATLEVYAAHRSGDLAVIAAVERQHGRMGQLPDQDLSLRVTQVFRRVDGGWRLVHRHADPLVHPIELDQLAVLARGGAAAPDA